MSEHEKEKTESFGKRFSRFVHRCFRINSAQNDKIEKKVERMERKQAIEEDKLTDEVRDLSSQQAHEREQEHRECLPDRSTGILLEFSTSSSCP